MNRRKRYKDLQLAQLRSFCLAATHGNFSEAAREAGISRAAVWQQVRALEGRLGLTLLQRRGRAIELTPDGRLLLDIVLPHVNGLDSLERLIEARRAELPQRLTLVSVPYLFSYHLREPLQEFAVAHSAWRLNLLTEMWPQPLFQLLERGQADIGLLPYGADEPRSPYLHYEELFAVPLLLLTAAQHPLARKKQVLPQDLAGQPMILAPAKSVNRIAQDHILGRHRLADQIHVVMENHHTDVVMKYAAAGLGIALWFLSPTVARSHPGLHARLFDPQMERLPEVMVTRKHAHLPEPVRELAERLRRFCADQSSSGDR
jgi:DNA-binding transcriptional LysR family regulator